MKRILSLILCLAMVLSMVPAQVFAETRDSAAEGCSEHSFTVETERKEPTCISEGSVTWKCANCDATQVQTLDIAADNHSYQDTVVAPGCTEEGYTEHICRYCGDKRRDTFVDAAGHSWQDASCITAKTCSVCGAAEGAALGHADADADHICDRESCGAAVGIHEAPDGAHVCDYCGQKVSDCSDANKDHACDVCAVQMGTHADADADHICDYGCADPIGDHADAQGDGNHICDYCGTEEILTQCSGGTATCLELAVCGECGQAYGVKNTENHASADYTYKNNEDGTHTAYHTCCDAAAETAAHTYADTVCICGDIEPVDSGKFCDGLTWKLDKQGLLTVSGAGAMESFGGSAPWAAYREQILTVQIGNGITVLGSGAFEGCSDLLKLSFPGSARVERNAFSGCTGLKKITVTAGSGAMWEYDAATCQNLPWYQTGVKNLTVKLDRGVSTVGAFAFCDAANVTGVELPDTLQSIGDSAFYGSALMSLAIPGSVAHIGDHALAGMQSISAVTIPGSVKTLGDYALSGSAFRAVELAEGLTAVSKGMFKDCGKLDTVRLPDSVQSIGEDAFYNCKALFGINVPEGVKTIEKNTFRNCVLNNIALPGSLVSIGEYAFAGNENLTKLTIPANVAQIGKNAFTGCKWLDTVTVNSTNLAVGENAFSGCENLKKVYFIGTRVQWDALLDNISSGNNSLKTASVICAADGGAVYNPVQEVQIYWGEERVDGRILLVDLNKTKTITLRYKVLPENSSNPEISWTTNEITMTDSQLDETGNLILSNMKPGDMTLFAQNFVSGSDDPYTYTTASVRLQFRRLTISGSHNGMISLNTPTQLQAVIQGDGDYSRGVRWSVENGSGRAVIDQNGVITGEAAGDVTVIAEAADGSGLAAEVALTVQEYSVAISGPDTVASGKSITLKAELIPENLTGTTIKWSLENPEDTQYVTLTASGKLTAKKGIQEKRTVTVVASAADGQAAPAKKVITVAPVTASVVISRDGAEVTGQTVLFDVNSGKTLSFAAVTMPQDAGKQVAWNVSDTKGTYVEYAENADGTIVLTHKGKTGTITLTATAMDGTGKKATVKVQFVKAAQHIEILNAPAFLRAGSKVTLTTNLAREEGLTDRNVVWSLSQDSMSFASITAKGVLTTYAYPDPVTITVRAEVKATPALKTEVKIQLLPGTQAVQISGNGQVLVKGQTVYAAVGEAVTLTGLALPEAAIQGGTWKVSGKNVEWTPSEDGKTVTVSMEKTGTATVTFTAGDGSKKNTSVKIQAVQRGQDMTITAKGGAVELRSGKSLQLTAAASGATVKKFSWSVSDPSVAAVSNTGKVKALTVYENKTVIVTAAAIDGSGLTAQYTLTIKPAKDETLHIFCGNEIITGTTRYLDIDGEAQSLTVKLYDAAQGVWRDVQDAAMAVSGKAVAGGENGIAPVAVGNGTVTAKFGKLSAKVTYKVVRSVQTITITAPGDWLLSGKSMKLTAAVAAAQGGTPTVKKLTWSVDNPTAATISASGSLKAAKDLTQKTVVTVTAAATDGSGVMAHYKVTICPQITAILVKDAVSGLTLNQCVREFSVGDTLKLTAKVLPKDAAQNMTWSISSNKLAELDAESGVLTLKGKGNLTIKAIATDGSKKSVTVKIKIV